MPAIPYPALVLASLSVDSGPGAMPTSTATLDRLARIATDLVPLAFVWHLLLLTAGLSLIAGWRPSNRTSARLLTAPLLSVAAIAFGHGVPFNGAIFAAACVLLLIVTGAASSCPATLGRPGPTAVGIALIGVAWFYPHFLSPPGGPWIYVYGAPLGLLPCPTVLAVIGFTLLGDGLGSRWWSRTLVAIGTFYGVLGVVWLGVWLDAALVAGAAVLAAATLGAPRGAAAADSTVQARRAQAGTTGLPIAPIDDGRRSRS